MEKDYLLENIRSFKKSGKLYNESVREAFYHQDLFESILEEEMVNTPERVEVLNVINNDNYIRNDYESFSNELKNNKRSAFLTPYTAEELERAKVQTFQVPKYEIGFALKKYPNGDTDIIGVHNNSNIKGIGEDLIDSAIRLGGTTLDHFRGFLDDFYAKKGFEEYGSDKWNPEYAPENWDYDTYGTPDIIYRRLKR